MGKGLKKFLAMVGVISLASGMGALSCSADKKDNKVENIISPNTPNTDEMANKDTNIISPSTPNADKTADKGANIMTPNISNADETANISTVPGKKGLSYLAVAGIAVGVAIVGASIALIVEKMLLNGDDSEN